MYCGGGFRSALTCDAAQRMGYKKVHSLIGGYKAMIAAGLADEKIASGFDPRLSRQCVRAAAEFPCQGLWSVDLRTPPGPEGSNGSLLCNCRSHPGTFSIC